MAKKAAPKKDAKKIAATPAHYDTIIEPVVTEKTTVISEQNKLVFKVAASASKPQVKESVEALFGAKVKAVNIINSQGKVKRFKGIIGKRASTKKAIVTLHEGQNIDLAAGAK